MITFGEAKRLLNQYAGRAGFCTNDDEVSIFTRKVLSYLLYSGQYGNLRKFCFCAVKGCFTIPQELEVIEKIAIDNELGTSWSKWMEWHQGHELRTDCLIAGNEAYEDPNRYCTVYDIPRGGARVGAIATTDEAANAYVIFQGKDPTGREIVTFDQGQQMTGEKVYLQKGNMHYTQVTFGEITGVLKSPTNGYVQAVWIIPDANKTGFLADYSPLEESPSYRRYRITSRRCGSIVKVSVLGRIRLKEKYTNNDLIPFDNLYTLELAAQAVQSNFNNDVQTAQAKDSTVVTMIERENSYKRVQNGAPFEVFHPLSPGAIRNIVFGRL